MPNTKIVKISTSIERARMPPRRAQLPDDVVPRPEVEVVSPEDERTEEQRRAKAAPPKDFFKSIPIVKPPLAPGASVALETLLGFLEAAEKILPPAANYPILSSARVRFDNGDHPRLIVEAGSHSVWSAVAIAAEKTTDDGFQAIMPVRSAKNILRALRETNKKVVIGVDAGGVCIGPHAVSFGGRVDDFPAEPVLLDWAARGAMPAFYLDEIVKRVLPARRKEGGEAAMHGILLDFQFHDVEGEQRAVCTVVATDDARLHALMLPRMVLDIKQEHVRSLPPSMVVDAGLFRYLRAVVNRDWAGLEFCHGQLIARGEDFIVVAKSATAGQKKDLTSWRNTVPTYSGFWMADQHELERVLKAPTADTIRIRIDAIKETLSVSTAGDGERFKEEISVRRFDGPTIVDVRVNRKFVLDAVRACNSGLVRLEFAKDMQAQSTGAIVIRGEDEQFKAVVMPLAS
jgi:hypothetical protein